MHLMSQITELDPIQLESLQLRYIHILEEFSSRCTRYSILYHFGHLMITVGSLIVPALLSVQYASNDVNLIPTANLQANIYWLTWALSLLVTMFNGILVLFKVDKKYFFLHTTRERLRSEGWQYLQLTGRYAGGLLQYRVAPTYTNQFVFFCHNVEKIRMRQIEEEYFKHEETNQTTSIQARNIQGTGIGIGTNGATTTVTVTDASGAPVNTSLQPNGAAKELYPPTFSDDIDRIYALMQQQAQTQAQAQANTQQQTDQKSAIELPVDAPQFVRKALETMIRIGGTKAVATAITDPPATPSDQPPPPPPPPTLPPPPRQLSTMESSVVPIHKISIDANLITDRILSQQNSSVKNEVINPIVIATGTATATVAPVPATKEPDV
jgi:hypothetical protein